MTENRLAVVYYGVSVLQIHSGVRGLLHGPGPGQEGLGVTLLKWKQESQRAT